MLVTVKVLVTTWPAAETTDLLASLTMVSAGLWVTVWLWVLGVTVGTGGPELGVPVVVAESVSVSGVDVGLGDGVGVGEGGDLAGGEGDRVARTAERTHRDDWQAGVVSTPVPTVWVSVTPTLVRVSLPVLVTVKVLVTTWPAAVTTDLWPA